MNQQLASALQWFAFAFVFAGFGILMKGPRPMATQVVGLLLIGISMGWQLCRLITLATRP